LGNISPRRVRLDPLPGTATKRDLLRLHGRNKLYELVDGTLVEKPMGFPEAHAGAKLIARLQVFLDDYPLGIIAGADALVELMPKLVRGPDVCFVSAEQLPDQKVPREQISKLIPSLVVEVLSPSNTRGEIARKLKEYFFAGVVLAWIIDPKKMTADLYTAPDAKTTIDASGVLDGGDVLPGFRVPLAKLFEQLADTAPAKKSRKKK
jgi:Uma2 family endonuclease